MQATTASGELELFEKAGGGAGRRGIRIAVSRRRAGEALSLMVMRLQHDSPAAALIT